MSDYNQTAANDAGYAVGAVEGDYNRADQDINRDENAIGNDFRNDVNDVEQAPKRAAQDVDQSFDNGVQDVKDIPSDIGSGFDKAANFIGDKFGGAEREGRDAEQDVNRFDQGMDNAYDQGEQQGEQQGF